MPVDEYPLTLRQADQARADFAAIEDDLEFIKDQLARLPTQTQLARLLLQRLRSRGSSSAASG